MKSYHLTPRRMAIIHKSGNNECWICGGKGTHIHCCRNINGHRHYGNSMKALQKIKKGVTKDPETFFVGNRPAWFQRL